MYLSNKTKPKKTINMDIKKEKKLYKKEFNKNLRERYKIAIKKGWYDYEV